MATLKTLTRLLSRHLGQYHRELKEKPKAGWCMTPLSRAQALEPRILLDAAGLVTMTEPVDNPDAADTTASENTQTVSGQENIETEDTRVLEDALAHVVPQVFDFSGEESGNVQNEIAFVDTNIQDYQTLINEVRPGVEVILINAQEDGFSQIADILTDRSNIDAIHLFSHGASGQVRMGTSVLETGNLQAYSDTFEVIQNALSENGDILIYGCNVAAGDTGSVFLGSLAEWTSSDIAASDDATGSAAVDGDWDLEAETGPIEAASAVDAEALSGYDGLLGAATDIAFSNYTIAAGNSLVNGLGGDGFDTKVLATDLTPQSLDDGYIALDISSVFSSGLKFGSTTYNAATQFFVGTNGYVTFGQGNTSFSPLGIAGSTLPMVAGQYDDIDLTDAPAQSAGGNSTGTHSLYYDIDTTNNVVTITYDDVGPYGGTAAGGDQDTGNAFQIRLHHINGSDFAVELRYENISWINGNSGLPTAGWTAGDQTNYGEVTGSGDAAFLNIETASNIGQAGVFVWEVRDGSPMTGQNIIPEDAAAGTFVSALEITDADGGETHTCTLTDDDGGRFEIYQEGGVWKVRVAAGATFDYETATTRTIDVKATGDTDGLSFTKTLTINLSDVNEAPTAANKTVSTNEDTAYTVQSSDFNFSDQDSGAAMSKVKITSLESSGTLEYNNSGTWQDVTLNQEITKADIDANKLRFTPGSNDNGAGYDSFNFKVSDGTNYSAAAYAMTVDVTAQNDAPTAADKTVTTDESTDYTFASTDFNFADVDTGDAISKVKITSLEGTGTLSYNNSGTWEDVTLNQEITKADIDADKLKFTPVEGASGSNYDSFAFKVSDGTAYSASAYTMTVDVNNVNEAPTDIALSANTITENEAGATVGTLSATDADTGDTAAFSIASDSSGLFEVSGTTLKLKGTSSADFETAATHNVTIRVTDGDGATYDEMFTVNVTDVNESTDTDTSTYIPPESPAPTTEPLLQTDISFQPTSEGNQVVEGVSPGDMGGMDTGEQPTVETTPASAMGNTAITPSRSGGIAEGIAATGSFGLDITAGPSGPVADAGAPDTLLPSAEGNTTDLTVHMGIADQAITAGESIRFEIPGDAFTVANENAVLSYQATQADGSPLPQWLTFSPETGSFTGQPPAGAEQTVIEITVIVKDGVGHEAATTFKIEVGGQEEGAPSQEQEEPDSNQTGSEGLNAPLTTSKAVKPDSKTMHEDIDEHAIHAGEEGNDVNATEGGNLFMHTSHQRWPAIHGKPSFSSQIQAAVTGTDGLWRHRMRAHHNLGIPKQPEISGRL